MEEIIHNGKVLGYIIRGTVMPDKTVFPAPAELELQVGFVVYPAGGEVAPHRHLPVIRNITRTCEVVLVKRGRCALDFYNDACQVVATRELCTDDVVILVSGGHGFRMLEDTILLEVKQGPYFGAHEMERLS